MVNVPSRVMRIEKYRYARGALSMAWVNHAFTEECATAIRFNGPALLPR